MPMDMESASTIHFDQYLALLKGFNANVRELVVYDAEVNFVWSSDADQSRHEALASLTVEQRRKCDEADKNQTIRCLGEDTYLELIDLKNPNDEIVLTLGLSLGGQDGTAPDPLARQENIRLLNELLLTEYEQSIALASQEDELNIMTDELTRRYEELNLIYAAEDQPLNIFHGRELLRQLASNTLSFLNVDIIYLFLPGKNVSIHKFKNDHPIHEFEKLLVYLENSVYPLLLKKNAAVVLNRGEDAKRLGLPQDLSFKTTTSAVVNAENEVIGMLAIANQDFAVDFTNSDRNLVDVMAKKASKIA